MRLRAGIDEDENEAFAERHVLVETGEKLEI